jgi:hypothetical protein
VHGIYCVIDTGYVKMKVYNPKMGMDALQVRQTCSLLYGGIVILLHCCYCMSWHYYFIDTGYVKMKVYNPKMGVDALQVKHPALCHFGVLLCCWFAVTKCHDGSYYVNDIGYVKMKVYNQKMGMDALQVRQPCTVTLL